MHLLTMRITIKSASILALVTFIFSNVANAHPGPVGHTHGDDWPFGLSLALILTIFVLLICLRKKFLRIKSLSKNSFF